MGRGACGLVSDAGLRVSNISIEQHVVMESLELAAALGAGVVYLCSGAPAGRTWEEAAEIFCAAIAPAASRAASSAWRWPSSPPTRSEAT